MTVLFLGVIVVAHVVPYAIPTTVVPPTALDDPATVFLVDYGRTPSIVLTDGSDTMVAYAYGDWRYYALRQQGIREGVAALMWPTQAGLGRKEIVGAPTAGTVRAGIGSGIEELHAFQVERQAVLRLRARLEELFHTQVSTATESYGMTFVHHPAAYTYWSNSNRMTAEWLRELGCEVNGPALSSSWRVGR